jgi:hypothetical protein
MNLNRILAAVSGILAALHDRWLVVIDSIRRKRGVPHWFFRGNVVQAQKSGVRCPAFADPLHSEMYSIGAISKPNNLVEPKFGANASQLCPVPAELTVNTFSEKT